MTVGEAKERIGSSEFVSWLEYFRQETNDFHREDWFLAAIRHEVYKLRFVLGGQPDEKYFDKCLIKFVAAQDGKPKPESLNIGDEVIETELDLTEDQKKARIGMSKGFWKAFTKNGWEQLQKAKPPKRPVKPTPEKRKKNV